MDGLVVVDKPAGCTSHDVVAKLRKIYGQRKVGHAGTLDPDATGVLLVGLGRVTRLLRFLQVAGKTYRGTVRLGVATSTLDAAGEVLDRTPMPVSREDVEAATLPLRGRHRADPPDGLGGEGRRPAPPRARSRGRGGRAGAPTGDGAPLRRRGARAGAVPARDRARRVLVGHVHPDPRRRPRRRARWVRAPRVAAPTRRRHVRGGRGAHPRGDRRRSFGCAAPARGRDARPRAHRGRRRAGPSRRARRDVHRDRARHRRATARSRSPIPTVRCSRSTSGGVPG